MVLCVTAKDLTPQPATDATVARLRLDVLDEKAEALGATSDAAKAELCGVDRVTFWRWRTGRLTPSLSRAMTIANRLGLELSDLIEQVAA